MRSLAEFASTPALAALAEVSERLATERRNLGFVRATEKRNWMSAFVREYQVPGNTVEGSRRIADAEVASTTAERMESEGEVAALEVERDFLITAISHAD